MVMTFFAIIAEPASGSQRIWLHQDEDGRWRLPSFTVEDEKLNRRDAAQQTLWNQVGLRTTLLQLLSPPSENVPPIVALRSHDLHWGLPSSNDAWLDPTTLEESQYALPTQGHLVLQWHIAQHSDTSPVLPPWSKQGWWSEMEAWLQEQEQQHGVRITGTPEQIKTWSISCLLRIPIASLASGEEDAWYFKAALSHFGREPLLTEQLALRYPQHLPQILATAVDAEADRYWMLMESFVGRTVAEEESVKEKEEALRAMARIQMDLRTETDSLLAWGCAKRPLSDLSAESDALLAELASPETRQLYGVTDEEYETFQRLASLPVSLCAELAAFGVPETLVHGDLHGGNVLALDTKTGNRSLIYDWTDGAVSHPFFDLILMLSKDNAESDIRLENAYLAEWEAVLPRPLLQEALAVSKRLAPLYHAISYRDIARNSHPLVRWELASGTGSFLRRFLEANARHHA